jgi:uncharacterized protein YbjQ (UPF0145 family)
LRAAGFEPVGQVMGNAVLNFAWWNEEAGPIRRFRPLYPQRFNGLRLAPRMSAYADLLYGGRRAAVDRMVAHCAALGGDGVVGVHMEVAPYPGDERAQQFTALGTAVRAAGNIRPAAPFASHLSAPDFTKLISAGWVPASIVFGVAVCEGSWSASSAPRRWGDVNRELRAWTDAITRARAEARDVLAADAARVGGDGVLFADADLQAGVHTYGPRGTGGGYCVAEATFAGTVIAAFGRTASPHPRVIPVAELTKKIPTLRRPDQGQRIFPRTRPSPMSTAVNALRPVSPRPVLAAMLLLASNFRSW